MIDVQPRPDVATRCSSLSWSLRIGGVDKLASLCCPCVTGVNKDKAVVSVIRSIRLLVTLVTDVYSLSPIRNRPRKPCLSGLPSLLFKLLRT